MADIDGSSAFGSAGKLISSDHSWGWISALLGTFAVGSVVAAIGLYKAIYADADCALLRKGKHKPGVFKGKVIWITGASQGIGEALAKYFASQGARLILSSRSKQKLEKVKASCTSTTPEDILVLPFDLLDRSSSLRQAAAAADAAFGGAGIDYLIHNAGASQHALASDTIDEVATQLLELNTLGPIKLQQAIMPYMLARRKGRLVVMSSMAAKVPSPGQAVYSASKMAVWGYFATLAAELADKGITVTIICPGPVATGVPGGTRLLYGAKGMIQRVEVSDSRRMSPTRVVELVANAMAAGLDEVWLAKHPVLLMSYLMQYAPSLGWLVLKKAGPSRARAVSEGQSGYDFQKFVGGSTSKQK